jgi:hypothetical protein
VLTLLPDLTLANLNLTNSTVNQGAALNYKVDIKNIGTGNATGNFTVKAYISTDNVLSTNDIQNGVIPTGNFNAGFTSSQASGASTIPSTLAAGQYYLILVVDADGQIAESNETNNTIVSTSSFTVNSIVVGNKEDLEVSILASAPNPAIYTNVSFTITVSNKGAVASGKFRLNMNTCTAGVIKTFLQNPGTLVYAGKPVAATQGVYDEINQTWTFNSLAAGASATYTIYAFTLTSKEMTMTAFVDQQTNTDFDSSPSATLANCTPVQDDESAAIINKGSTRESVISFDLNDKLTVFPNPAGELINVNIASWDKEALTIKIFNTLGVQVSYILLDENHTPVQILDISEIQDGTYYIFIESKERRSQAIKFVKQQSF